MLKNKEGQFCVKKSIVAGAFLVASALAFIYPDNIALISIFLCGAFGQTVTSTIKGKE